jgi:hypothetical protein
MSDVEDCVDSVDSDDKLDSFDAADTDNTKKRLGKKRARAEPQDQDQEEEDDGFKATDDEQKQLLGHAMESIPNGDTDGPQKKHRRTEHYQEKLNDNSPGMTVVKENQFLANAKNEGDPNMKVKTLNVKDFRNTLVGCCNIPDISSIVITFTPQGMQIFAQPQTSSTFVTTYFNKEFFSEYNVQCTTQRIVQKSRLDYLKKNISKDVTFLEITAWHANSGFTFSGYRSYKSGGDCRFRVNIAEIIDASIDTKKIPDMSQFQWSYVLRCSSETFKNNIDFIDDDNESVRISIENNKIEFQGIQENGSEGESIVQEIESNISEKFDALFHKKHLKIITATKDLNRSLTIRFNIPSVEFAVFPVVFCYELDNASPMSTMSCYMMPKGIEVDS